MSVSMTSVLSSSTKRLPPEQCTPVKWSNYFEKQHEVRVKEDNFNIYSIGTTGPVLLLIHGGGYSALTWSLLAKDIADHVACRIVAIDLRGHGNTKTDDETDFSLDVLVKDVADAVKALFDDAPPTVLVGHSLGGAIAVGAASVIPNVVGLCVIDVAETLALRSLSSMKNVLQKRPSHFKRIEHAIEWCIKSGQTNNLEAARVSMPGQIMNSITGELAANEAAFEEVGRETRSDNSSFESIEEETVDVTKPDVQKKSLEGDEKTSTDSSQGRCKFYIWRTDLDKTEPFWKGWFEGLSQKFLDVQAPKVLLLANIHGLDTALTVGQMQGKFQIEVLPRSGHAIQEDHPIGVAKIITKFLVKQKLATSIEPLAP